MIHVAPCTRRSQAFVCLFYAFHLYTFVRGCQFWFCIAMKCACTKLVSLFCGDVLSNIMLSTHFLFGRYKMQTVNCRLQTAGCRPGTKCRLQTEYKMQADKKFFFFRNVVILHVIFDLNLHIVLQSP